MVTTHSNMVIYLEHLLCSRTLNIRMCGGMDVAGPRHTRSSRRVVVESRSVSAVLLDVSTVTVRYGGAPVVDALSVRHAAGGVVGVIGPNGAGKTTFLNVLSGAIAPTSGRIRLGDRDVTGLAPDRIARMGITRTFQNLQVFGSLTALQNVLLPRMARSRGTSFFPLPAAARRRRRIIDERGIAQEMLDRVGIGQYAHTPAGELAYGFQRRVEIARALAGDPALLLLDEPLAGLSRAESADLADLFRDIADDGVTVLLVEHDVATVLAVSQRVLVLHHGRLLADDTPRRVSADPAVRDAYLGEGWT